jgi:hypothetical protein
VILSHTFMGRKRKKVEVKVQAWDREIEITALHTINICEKSDVECIINLSRSGGDCRQESCKHAHAPLLNGEKCLIKLFLECCSR